MCLAHFQHLTFFAVTLGWMLLYLQFNLVLPTDLWIKKNGSS
jgi:hypothetical protein